MFRLRVWWERARLTLPLPGRQSRREDFVAEFLLVTEESGFTPPEVGERLAAVALNFADRCCDHCVDDGTEKVLRQFAGNIVHGDAPFEGIDLMEYLGQFGLMFYAAVFVPMFGPGVWHVTKQSRAA